MILRGKAGLAHLTDLLMFRHHNGFSNEAVGRSKPGVPLRASIHSARYLSSYTSRESTNSSRSAELGNLRKILREEAIRLYTGCKLIPEAEVQDAKEFVAKQIRAREELPAGKARLELIESVYPTGHPYRRWIDGKAQQVLTITHRDICAFTKNYFVPSRVIVVVTGNVGHEELGTMVQEFFGGIERGEPKPLREVPRIEVASEHVIKPGEGETTTINVVWSLPRHFTDEYNYASVMKVFHKIFCR